MIFQVITRVLVICHVISGVADGYGIPGGC